ncbi:MAG TPA: hypothetical protein VNO52_17410 [Methylomirabilota bacterium]|nr:hypothetical protein [Methylomirabilota bacterium]
MSPDQLVFLYCTAALAAIAGLALYSHRRQKRFGPSPSADTIFRCEQCGFVYTDDPDVDRSRCQQCGTLNEAIRF